MTKKRVERCVDEPAWAESPNRVSRVPSSRSSPNVIATNILDHIDFIAPMAMEEQPGTLKVLSNKRSVPAKRKGVAELVKIDNACKE